MTPEERDRLFALCKLISEEKDPKKFITLVEQLNDLLETRRELIQGERPARAS